MVNIALAGAPMATALRALINTLVSLRPPRPVWFDPSMRTIHSTQVIAAGLAIVASVFALASTRQPEIRRTDLLRNDLSAAGQEVIQVRVDFAPGASFPKHKHPGEEVAYVLEGTLEYRLDGGPAITLKAGDALFIPAGTVHEAANVGKGNGAELATYIVAKGEPLVVLAP